LRGLEPDEAYWIQNESAVRDRDDLDLDVDPPPDLVLEVEISRSTLNRMGIYAALKVPEVWRWDGEKLTVCLLGKKGNYAVSERSKAFPFLPLADLVGFMKRAGGETAVIRSFRKWIREQQAAGWKKD
jgi:Uma2 family endonuclease